MLEEVFGARLLEQLQLFQLQVLVENGFASSITGSPVTYSGGGGGSTLSNTPVKGTGESGGGGNGGAATGCVATSGTVNTGSGGGGAINPAASGTEAQVLLLLEHQQVLEFQQVQAQIL